MVKLVVLIRRLPHLSHEEFVQHWREVHAPRVAAGMPGLRKIQISAALRMTRGDGEPPYDGIIEQWFDDMDSCLASLASDEVKEISKGTAAFVDHANTVSFIT